MPRIPRVALLIRSLALLALWIVGAASAPSAELVGAVVDQAGDPVAGAQVWVNQDRDVMQASTDAGGRFTIDGIGVAMTEVVVYKEGYALGGRVAPVAGNETTTVTLRPADVISLKVSDTDFEPIAGVKVRSMLIERRTLVSVTDLERYGFPALRSTDDGILVIPNLPVDGFVQLVLHHIDFADSSIRYLPVDSEQRNIVMKRGGRASGRITHDGEGVAKARVSIYKVGPQGQKEFAEVLTDEEGFYRARLEAGEYHVAAEHPDFAPPRPKPLRVHTGRDAEPVGLEMRTPHYIEGSILLPSGDPCPAAGIRFRVEDTIFAEAATGNDGKFRLRVPGEPGALSVAPPAGYMMPTFGDIGVDFEELETITLEPIVLEPLPVITGTVEDVDGNAPGRTLVTALNLPVPLSVITDVPIPFSVLSDEDGTFRLPLDFMPPVEELELRAEHGRRFQRAEFSVEVKDAEPARVRMKQFQPDLANRKPVPGANNLAGLIGEPAPALTGDTWVNSDPVTLDDIRGKVVVLLFWAGFDESIGPIVLRELHVVHELLKDVEDVVFLGVHDAISSEEEIDDFIKQFNIPYPVMRDADGQTTFSTYGIVFIPQLVLIDKQGRVRYYQTEGRLLELIKGLRRE